MNIKKKLVQGFTLIELLIVVIILSILAAIVIPQFSASTDDAKTASAQSSLSNLRSVIDLYYQQHGEYPGAKLATGCGNGSTAGTGAAHSASAAISQLTLYTDGEGVACSKSGGGYDFGPYYKKTTLPGDPFTNNNVLVVLDAATSGDLNMNATGTTAGGWKLDPLTGKILINHEDHDDL
ncbi:type IV pilin protein [Oceanisphaera arctica]|uniref:Prepilin-type N-terminal cleavage/methylation domain-containing protein n=1 Tax=Oceanisphaera arctica TaxID=641510 RepID=A0A2P5TL99_9GAMM|nr:type II secretion system protein [Oceanisphaera arctica]PPL16048.1 hypothetical protein UN63_10605 [Oceanisphaera arctica]GHA15226.1 hypothetical protein GCM10007082_15000 [Oceanisphaera arctica]